MRPSWLRFPETVNEKAARVVAAGVLAQAALFIATRWSFLLFTLVFGFTARVLFGPTFSPLARFAVHVVAPRLGPVRPVAGAPKRFAQGVGLAFSTGALVAWLAGSTAIANVVLVMLIGAAALEAGLGICLGCWAYGHLVRLRVIPESVCVECADITLRRRPTAA